MSSRQVTGRTAFHGALLTSAWTLGSRLLGFVRDALMVAAFGMSAELGAFNVAWIVPNLFRKLFGEGAVGAAIQPALARAREEGGIERARGLFMRFHGLLAMTLVVMVAVGEAAIWLWRARLGESDPETALALRYAAILLPYALPICLTALAAAPQNLTGRFVFPALAPLLLNLVWITCLLLLVDLPGPAEEAVHASADDGALLCFGVLAGGVLQWLLQAPGVRGAGFPLLPRLAPGDGEVRRTMRSFLPALAGLAAIQINMALDQGLVWMIVGPEANTYAYLANRLLQLPLALISISAATGALPLFARLAAERNFPGLSHALRNAAESSLILIVAAAAGLFAVAVPTIKVLFEHGHFESGDSELLGATLRAYLLCLPAATLSGLLTRVRQARGDFAGPARIALISVPVNIGLDLLLLPRFGVPGAGIATAAALSVQALLLSRGLGTLEIGAPLRLRRLPRLVAPGLVAGALAAVLVWQLGAKAATLPGLAVAIGAGAAAAVAATAVLLPREFGEFRGGLRRRRR
ncbi:MAG: murein biosynthesis integral membrane protein MurJ [Planctomycetes bacterium]|nr:murein biosynthesis integral membrane protein MurJ [Planctomycetota bacterium]MBL7008011.1 murein biosynthesis integral membrane protein MurJ [Planctomycetota bacterium]